MSGILPHFHSLSYFSTLLMQCSVMAFTSANLSCNIHSSSNSRHYLYLPTKNVYFHCHRRHHHRMPNKKHITNSIKMKMIHNSKAITAELLKLSCEYEFRALHPSLLNQRNLCNSTSYLLLLLMFVICTHSFAPLTHSLTHYLFIPFIRSFVAVLFSFWF